MTLLLRTTLAMVVAMWCTVHLRWMLSSANVVFSTQTVQDTRSHDVTRIRPSEVDMMTLTAEIQVEPRKLNYAYSTDERLLQDAVEASRRRNNSSAASQQNKKPRIAFLFLVRGEIPFEPLWRRYFAGHDERYSVYVHAAPNFTFPRSSFFYGKQIPSKNVERLSRSLADAVRRLVAMALVDVENRNTWFVNLCEATIPVRSFDETYRYLMRSRHSFVQSFQPMAKYWGTVPQFNNDELRKGEVWMALRRWHAVMLVADRATYAVFVEQCRKLCSFDERYFQTLLHLRDPAGIANRTVMFVDWSGRKLSSPRTFDAVNTNVSLLETIAGLTEDSVYGQHYNTAFPKFRTVHCAHNGAPGAACFLFARKFHPSSLDVVLHWFEISANALNS